MRAPAGWENLPRRDSNVGMTRIVFLVSGALGAACLAAAFLHVPARAADDACTTPACTPSVSLASALVVPGARKADATVSRDGPQEWIADLRNRTYFDASCAAAAELDADSTLRMRFERTLIDLGYRRSDAPGC